MVLKCALDDGFLILGQFLSPLARPSATSRHLSKSLESTTRPPPILAQKAPGEPIFCQNPMESTSAPRTSPQPHRLPSTELPTTRHTEGLAPQKQPRRRDSGKGVSGTYEVILRQIVVFSAFRDPGFWVMGFGGGGSRENFWSDRRGHVFHEDWISSDRSPLHDHLFHRRPGRSASPSRA